jgi:serine protease Do
MSRLSSPIILLATLGVGIVIGLAADRRAPFVAAQATPPVRADATAPNPSERRDVPSKPGDEDAIYKNLARQYEEFAHVNRTFELVAKVVSPAVVHIVARKTGSRSDQYQESGSGVIVRGDADKELYVLTNEHVVERARAEKIAIFLHDGRSIRPTRLWSDALADVAVLALGRKDLPAARFGDSDDVVVGSWVLALGSPFGLTHSVSQGIISARGRQLEELEEVKNQDFFQTDAAINPGNSGGPLVNMKGEIIGINSSIASNGGGNEGVGFSIPINLARWIMNQLIANGRVARGALGIVLHASLRPEDAQTLGLERPRGAWVSNVYPDSPAAAAGMRNGDVIVRFRGVDVKDLNHLINMVSMARIGDVAEVVVWRDGKLVSLNVRVGDRDRTVAQEANEEMTPAHGLLRRPERPAAPPTRVLGIELATLDENTAHRIGLPATEHGAIVMNVADDSPLANLFDVNDVIYSVDGRSIKSADEAAKLLARNTDHTPLVLEFDRVVNGTIERRQVRIP